MKHLTRKWKIVPFALLIGAILFWTMDEVHATTPLGEIMPLGDSITYGISVPSMVPGGYRDRLNTRLKSDGYSFTFVGSQPHNSSPQLTTDGQMYHEGHGGYTVDDIATYLDGNPEGSPATSNGGYWLTGTGDRAPIYPEYILLHIGTNDLLLSEDVGVGGSNTSHLQARLKNLITKIVTLRPDTNVIVSSLIPIAKNVMREQVWNYNAAIKNSIVPYFIGQGKHVSYVDNYSNFVDANGDILRPQRFDGVHPTLEGYECMGETWAAGIEAIATPEPATVALLAAGLFGMLKKRHNRRFPTP